MERKIISFMMIASLVVGLLSSGIYGLSEARASGNVAYEELTVNDFGIRDTQRFDGYDHIDLTTESPEKSLDGKAITGIYNFSTNQGGSRVTFGGSWYGVRIVSWGDSLELHFKIDDTVGLHSNVLMIYPSDINKEAITGCDLKIRTSFAFENVNDDMADVVVGIEIGDSYQNTVTFDGVPTANLKQVMSIHVEAGSSHTVKPIEEDIYEELTVNDFGVFGTQRFTGYSDAELVTDNSTESLNGKAITGIYNFSTKEYGSRVTFGSQWYGVRIVSWGNCLEVHYKIDDVVGLHSKVLYIYPQDINMENITGCDLQIRTSFKFMKVEGDVADVRMGIEIGDSYRRTITFDGVPTTNLKEVIGVHVEENAEQSISALQQRVYDKLTLDDFGITGTRKFNGYAHTDLKTATPTVSLDGKEITGIYNFSPVGGGSRVTFGSSWFGVRLLSLGNKLELHYKIDDTLGLHDKVLIINPEDVGLDAITGCDLKVKLAFAFENVNGNMADVVVDIEIGGNYRNTVVFDGVSTENLMQQMSVHVEDGATHYMTGMELYMDDFAIFGTRQFNGYRHADFETTTPAVSLDGKAINGIYNFSTKEYGSRVTFGSSWFGVRIWSLGDKLELHYKIDDTVGLHPNVVVITPEDIGSEAITGCDLKMRVAFDFKNVNGDIADVTLAIQIGDNYKNTVTFDRVPITNMKQQMSIHVEDGATHFIKGEEKSTFDELTLADFGIYGTRKFDGYFHWDYDTVTPEESLDGKAITGIYNFSTKDYGSRVTFGSSWFGFRIWSLGEQLELHYKIDDTVGLHPNVLTLTPADVGLDKITGCDLKIRLEFTFKNVEGDIADVEVGIEIGQNYKNTMLFDRVPITNMNQMLSVHVEEGATHVIAGTDLSLNDFGIYGKQEFPSSNHAEFMTDTPEESLNGRTITGIHNFSTVPGGSRIGFGSSWHGVRIFSLGNKLELHYKIDDTVGIHSKVLMITPEDINQESITGCDLKLQLSFAIQNVNGDMADVEVHIVINDSYQNRIVFDGVPIEHTKQIISVHTEENGKHFVTAPTTEETGRPYLNNEFEKLTFDSYMVYSGVYGYDGTGALSVQGYCKKNSLDKVIFTDTLHFTDKAGSYMKIGGKTNGWEGLLFASSENGNLTMMDSTGSGNPEVLFNHQLAGFKLTDRDVKITLSFEYVDADKDGKKDDVKLGVWFDGKAYNDEWIYLYNVADKLGGYFGIYSGTEGSNIGIKTYNRPIDFTEWGLTTEWKITLGLK